jgi:D-alanine-D-alanine ligase
MKKTVCLLYGGKSQEHEVSRQSAASIFAHIDRQRQDIVCVGIGRDGTWHYQETPVLDADPARGDMLRLTTGGQPVSLVPGKGFFTGSKPLPVDIVFPVLHGPFGEDGTLQGLLEMAGVPYAGAGVLGSALAMDKEKAKQVWREQGLPVVDSETVYKAEFRDDPRHRSSALDAAARRFGFPLFVKPVTAGSSVGVAKVGRPQDLAAALEQAFRFDDRALVERAVAAREIECAVIGNERLRVFPPGEIIPAHEYYSYEAKYLDPDGARLDIPAEIPAAVAARAMELAGRAYRCLALEGFARVDLFLDRTSGKLFVNEINSIPGFTNISMFPRLCAAGGLPYRELINTLLDFGYERHARRSELSYDFIKR